MEVYAAIGAALEEARQSILAAYFAGLADKGNPLVVVDDAWQQARAQADAIITDVVTALSGHEVDYVRRAEMLSGAIGVARAEHNIHQSASLEAASILFRTILDAGSAATSRSPDPVGAMATMVVVLNDSLTARVRQGAASYASFLLNSVHDAQVAERRRIARDLHDRVGAGAAVAYRQLEYAVLTGADGGRIDQESVSTALESVASVLGGLRQLTTELRLTEPLDSLEIALRRFAEESRPDGNSEVIVRVSGDESWAPPVVLDETFLIVREAVRNALQHNDEVRVLVTVDIAPNSLSAGVYDDGTGFGVADRSGPSSGVDTMAERAALLGGRLDISSSHGDGTAVRLFVPLDSSRTDAGEPG